VKPYLLSLGIGFLVGVIYGLFNVRSPAPPVIALVGLLGILLGEQAVPLAKMMVAQDRVSLKTLVAHFRTHTFGHLPTQSAAVSSRPQDGT
jgi:XapX domain-containing protein